MRDLRSLTAVPILHNDQADGDLHNDQTDGDLHTDQRVGDLHNDQTYFDTEIYREEHLELKLKLSNMCAYIMSHSLLPKRIYLDWKIEDSDGGWECLHKNDQYISIC